jgi:DNA polymerase
MEPYGKGKQRILLVGEGPGEDEDRQGRPFVGVAGQRLREVTARMGVDIDQDCVTTNAVVCRPMNPRGRNRAPLDKEINSCRPGLLQLIKDMQPEVIVLLGGVPVASLLGLLWKEHPGGITRWAGWKIPCQRWNCWICPTWHPSYLLREESPVLDRQFEQHLHAAFDLPSRPWGVVPEFRKDVKVILDHEEAGERVRRMIRESGIVAWDLETTGLKPDSDAISIYSCSLSDGAETISFPWHGKAVLAMWEFVLSDVPKIGANIKFETRFIRKEFGCDVQNWKWDTVLAAHVLDNRQKVSSVKFQAFCRLGQEPYNEMIAPYLKSVQPGGNSPNRIREFDLRECLVYGGLDSLLEFKIAFQQMQEMGVTV